MPSTILTRRDPAAARPSSQRWGIGSGRARAIVAGAALMLAGAIAHAPAIPGGFIWDDEDFIHHNPLVLSNRGLQRIWFSTDQPDYWPVTYTTLWLDWRIWGEETRGYRMENILLHGLNAILVWRLARRLAVPGAWLAGLLFVIHPLSVEAVDWLFQRKTLLATAFSLGALDAALWAHGEGRPRRMWPAALLFALAMLGKTSAVMIPLVFLVLIWWQKRRLGWRDLAFAAPLFGIALGLGTVAMWFQHYQAIGEDIVRTDSVAARVIAAGYSIWFYLCKAVLPWRLSFLYPRWQIDPHWLPGYLPLATVVLVFAIFFYKRASWGAAPLAALACYVLNLLPTLGLVDVYFMKYSFVADHWQYLALPALLAFAVGVAASLAQRIGRLRMPSIAVAAAVAIAFLAGTASRAAVFGRRDNEPLWRDTIAKNPDAWMAWGMLGRMLAARGQLRDALPYLSQSVRLAPDDPICRFNLAAVLSALGKTELAESHFQRVATSRPDTVITLNQLGRLAAAAGRDAQAMEHYRRALVIAPDNAEALAGVGILLCKQDRLDDGEAYLRRALKSDPYLAIAHHNLGLVYVTRGQHEAALGQFQLAIDQNPGMLDAHVMRGEALYKLGRLADSTAAFQLAVALEPRLATARFGLGRALADEGLLDEAAEQLKQALMIEPTFAPAQQKLAEVESRLAARPR